MSVALREPLKRDPFGLICAVIFSAALTTCLIVAAVIHFFPPDAYLRSEYRPAVITAIDEHTVSFDVTGQHYPALPLGDRCQLKVRKGHKFTATVDILKSRKGRIYGALNWASLRREFCS